MDNFSVLIGGKAGFGIDKSGLIIARILNQLCYRLYIYRDYPSIIRGGHTFSIIRASKQRIATHQNKVDFILVLNQDTVDFHKDRLKDNSIIIYDSDSPIALGTLYKKENPTFEERFFPDKAQAIDRDLKIRDLLKASI